MNDSEFEPTFHQNHQRRKGRHECYVGPFQNGNVLAQNYPQYHREGHFKQITRQNRKGNGHLLGFPSLKGITEQALAPSPTSE